MISVRRIMKEVVISDYCSVIFNWAIPMSGVGIMDGKWIWPDTKEFSLPGTVRDGLYPYYGKGYNTSAGEYP